MLPVWVPAPHKHCPQPDLLRPFDLQETHIAWSPPQHTPIPCENSQKRNKRERKKQEKALSDIPVGWRLLATQGAVALVACGGIRERAQRTPALEAHKCNEVLVTPAPLHTLNGSHWSAGNWGFKNTNYSNCLLRYWEGCNKHGAQHCRAMS